MSDQESQAVERAYTSFAPLYDFFFGLVLEPGRRAAIRSLQLSPGDKVLEVGVGTGLSLHRYPREAHVEGIDLAVDMLAKAQRRVERKGLAQVKGLHAMDARALTFEDDSFDAVVAMYVVSVTGEEERVVGEMRRVCKPGGLLVIVNHFKTRSFFVRMAEVLLRPIHRAVRFRADLELDDFTRRTGLVVERSFRANIFGYSTILCCSNGDR
jgi:phosphatidylethanolamine/phosphatidyl-N-methylethanolamine N-methyltransferase